MSDVAKDLDFKYSLTRDLLPAVMNEDEQNLLKVLIEKYYMYMECYDIHYSNLVLDEPGITTEVPEDIQTESGFDVLRESLRTQDSTFVVGETITGSTSKATAVIRGVQEKGQLAGGHTMTDPHHMWATPLNGVSFILDETVTGSETRASAKISELKINPVHAVKDFFKNLDINTYQPLYKKYFRQEFIPNVPIDVLSRFENVIKQILTIYRTKGTEAAYKWLWRTVYNSDNIEFYYPRTNVLKVSDGEWKQEKSLKINLNSATNVGSFLSKKITGQTSGATAIVEGYKEITIGATTVGDLAISGIIGTFASEEEIRTEIDSAGIIATGVLLSVVQSVTINSGGTNYTVGDKVFFTGGGGVGANAQVSAIRDGIIDSYNIEDGGEGYIIGDNLSFSGGSPTSNASATVGTITESGQYFFTTSSITENQSTALNAANYAGALSGSNANTHLYSNAQTTFLATVNNTTNFVKGLKLTDTKHSGAEGTTINIVNSTALIYAIPNDDSPNFLEGDNPSILTAFYANGSAVSSTSALISDVASSSNSSYFGALYESTGNWQSYGSIKEISVSSAGAGYQEKPSISVQNLTISELHPSRFKKRSRILQFQENVLGDYIIGDIIQGDTSFTKGLVLDPLFSGSANSTFSALRYLPQNVSIDLDSTDGSADAGSALLLEDGYNPSHGSYSGTTSAIGSLISEITEFTSNEIIRVERSSLILSNTHTSNADFDDGKTLGLNANVEVGVLTIGAISEIEVVDPGLGYTTIPTATANSGDNNAILTVETGPLNTFPPRYTGTRGLLNQADKVQDSLYYQEFSYVIKTDIPITEFRDVVKTFQHPAGYALFGEIAIRSQFSARITLPYSNKGNANTNLAYLDYIFTPTLINNNSLTTGGGHYEIETASTTILANTQITIEDELVEIEFKDYNSDTTILNVGFTGPSDVVPNFLEQEIQSTTNARMSATHEYAAPEVEYILPKVNTTIAHDTGTDSWVSTLKTIHGSIFAEAGDSTFRRYPTVAEFFEVHETSSADEVLQWYASADFSQIHIIPDDDMTGMLNEKDSKEIMLPDINIELEEEFNIVNENGSDFLGLEDGLNPSDGSYTTASGQGKIKQEVYVLLKEDNVPLAIYDGYQKLFRIESINTGNNASLELYSLDGTFLNESILSLNKLITQPFIPAS